MTLPLAVMPTTSTMALPVAFAVATAVLALMVSIPAEALKRNTSAIFV